MKIANLTSDFGNISVSKMSTRKKKNDLILQPMLLSTVAKTKNCEVVTLDDTIEEEKKVNSADKSIEFIRCIDRRASKRKRVIDTLIKKKSELRKRPIVIDGSNVAIEHGIQTKGKDWFSVKGLEIAINYFKNKGHEDIKVVVPRYRLSQNDDRELMKRLQDQKYLVLTPSRIIRGRRVTSYDDRYIIDLAVENRGVILSNDQYRDLLNESGKIDEAINFSLLPFNFVNDLFMLPKDPLGRGGPTLEDFLQF